MSKFGERGLLAAAAGADGSQLSFRTSMARSSPGSCSCALAVTELWLGWLVLLQKRWACANRLSSSVNDDDNAYMNWNGTQSLFPPTSLTPAARSSFLTPLTSNVRSDSSRPLTPVIFGQWNEIRSPLIVTRLTESPGTPAWPRPLLFLLLRMPMLLEVARMMAHWTCLPVAGSPESQKQAALPSEAALPTAVPSEPI